MSTPTDEPWLLATGTQGDDPLICRLRTRPPSEAERAERPLLVMIRWSFETDDGPLPDEDDLDAMAGFEEALDAAMDAQGWGMLMVVVTTGGVREWRIYTQDFDRFQDGLNDALMDQPRYPLEFETFEDPAWRAYDEIASSMVPRGQA